MKFIDGGICASQGFSAWGVHCGVKSSNKSKKDVAVIYSEAECSAAAVYTKNRVKAAPIHITREHIANGKARAIVANSGNANACAVNGEAHAEEMCVYAANALKIDTNDVLVASTGVIGQELNIGVIEKGIPEVVKNLSRQGSSAAAEAIMTTDTVKKECAVEFKLKGKTVHVGGIAKGTGMIHPNMGTMLCFIGTDIAISSEMIKKALLDTVNVTFNRISVDGDTSTNDMCIVLANGLSGNTEISAVGEEYDLFLKALKTICTELARKMAGDGEGASHLITCTVRNASDEETAETMAKSVISSSLTKAAIFGSDANWGRVLCAMGYSGAEFDPEKADISFKSAAGEILVCENGRGLVFDEDLAKKVLSEKEVIIDIDIKSGNAQATCWGCDLTYEYVKINGEYRT